MKKFFKQSGSIAKLGIISLLICAIITIFKTSTTLNVCNEIRPWGELIFNICISIFAAFVFYILQVYIPGERELKNAKEALKNDFLSLARMLDIVSIGIENFVDITDGKVQIKWNDPHGGRKLFFGIISGNNNSNGTPYCYSEKELLDLSDRYKQDIQNIKNSIFARYLDYDLVELLSELEKAPVIGAIRSLLFCANSGIGYRGLNKILDESKKTSLKVQKEFNTTYTFGIKELSATERVISANAQIFQKIIDIPTLNKEITVEAAWEQAINNPDILNAINGDKDLLYKLVRQAILEEK